MSPTTTGANASKSAKARWLVPLVLVNAIAILGQCLWAWDHLVPASWRGGWGVALGVPVALAFAAALESIGIYLSAEADERAKASQPYGLLRGGAYGMGLVAGALNFWHFAGSLSNLAGVESSALTLACAMGLLSTLSPALWAVRSKRLNRASLEAAGVLDKRLLRLGMGRKLLHPVLSFHLVRWASWEGLEDVDEAVAAWDAAGRPKNAGKAGERPASLVVAAAERILANARDRAEAEAARIAGEAAEARAALLAEADQIVAEARHRAAVDSEAELAEARREAEAHRREARARADAELLEAQRRAEAELQAAEALRREAEEAAAAAARPARHRAGAPTDELAEARRRREQEPPADMVQVVADLADELGREPKRDEVKTLCRVGSTRADEILKAYRALPVSAKIAAGVTR